MTKEEEKLLRSLQDHRAKAIKNGDWLLYWTVCLVIDDVIGMKSKTTLVNLKDQVERQIKG